MKLRFYLSGSIKKGAADDSKKSYWTDDDISVIDRILSAKYELVFMNPAVRSDDLSDFKSTFGRDLLQVFVSDIVLVDARDRKGLGIGSEMTFAKLKGIPVISIAPTNTQYVKNDFEYLGQKMDRWIHPFIGGLSDYIAESVEDAANYILTNYPFTQEIKGVDYLSESMQHYVDSQLAHDVGMKEYVEGDETIRTRIMEISTKK